MQAAINDDCKCHNHDRHVFTIWSSSRHFMAVSPFSPEASVTQRMIHENHRAHLEF